MTTTRNTSRRALLAAALATGAAANALAIATGRPSEVDPVFAIIKRHRAALEAYDELHGAVEAIDALIPNEGPPEEYWDWPKKQRDAWQKATLARWEAAARDAGREFAYDRWCGQGDQVTKITKEFAATPPTTMAGMAAVLAHWSEIMNEDSNHLDFYDTRKFLGYLAEAIGDREALS
jgi:hypothetical protein